MPKNPGPLIIACFISLWIVAVVRYAQACGSLSLYCRDPHLAASARIIQFGAISVLCSIGAAFIALVFVIKLRIKGRVVFVIMCAIIAVQIAVTWRLSTFVQELVGKFEEDCIVIHQTIDPFQLQNELRRTVGAVVINSTASGVHLVALPQCKSAMPAVKRALAQLGVVAEEAP